jgi:beta-glucosidase
MGKASFNPVLEPVCLPNTRFDNGWESWMGRHESVCRAAREGDPEVIFIGDSITHFWEDTGKPHWKKNYAKYSPINMGFGGDRIQHLLWRLQNGELEWISPKVAVLLIGTNNSADNTAEQIAEGIEAVCALIHKKLPQTRILLLAIFPRDTPDAPRRKVNEAVNEIIAGLDDGAWIHFRDMRGIWVDETGAIKEERMADRLHPTRAGYAAWAEALTPAIEELLGG